MTDVINSPAFALAFATLVLVLVLNRHAFARERGGKLLKLAAIWIAIFAAGAFIAGRLME